MLPLISQNIKKFFFLLFAVSLNSSPAFAANLAEIVRRHFEVNATQHCNDGDIIRVRASGCNYDFVLGCKKVVRVDLKEIDDIGLFREIEYNGLTKRTIQFFGQIWLYDQSTEELTEFPSFRIYSRATKYIFNNTKNAFVDLRKQCAISGEGLELNPDKSEL